MEQTVSFEQLDRAMTIARDVVAPHATLVDRDATFPSAAFIALREAGLLSSVAPKSLGGLGCSPGLTAAICSILAEACGSVGLIFAMHQAQLMSLCRHAAAQPYIDDIVREAVSKQWLIASATSEADVGGDLRSSVAFLERVGETFALRKRCTSISYGREADAILVTARRDADASGSDQLLALVTRADYVLEDIGTWMPMGMRGTLGPPSTLFATGNVGQILSKPFRFVASETMVPMSHLLWAACWWGIARGAVATATARIRTDARGPTKCEVRGAMLAHAVADLDVLQSFVLNAALEYGEYVAQSETNGVSAPTSMALRANSLKLGASRLATGICLACLEVCGLEGYLEDAPHSIARALRDVLSAQVMISNHRLAITNAALLQVVGGDWRNRAIEKLAVV